jgi:hypothetical protein
LVAGLTTAEAGEKPNWTVATTLLVEPLMTEVVFASKFITYTMLVVGLTATATGSDPTCTVANRELVEPSMTMVLLKAGRVT